MKSKILFYCILVLLSLNLISCLSLSSVQSGKTLGKEKIEGSIVGTMGEYSQISTFGEDGIFDYKPSFGLKIRYGATDKIDFGANIDQSLVIGASVKYQFLGNIESRFASSIGFELGFSFMPILIGDINHYLSIPLFLSFHPKDNFVIFLTPRFLYASDFVFASLTGAEITESKISKFGNSYGFIFGRKHKIALELSNFNNTFFKPTNFSIGYILTLRQ